LEKFQADLDQVNAKIARVLAPMKGKEIFVFHPAYGYFTHRYGLKQVAVETGGKEPSAKQLAALIDKAKAANVKVIFVQPQFDKKNAETVAKTIGGAVVSLNPLAVDYIKNLDEMASKVESALSKGN
jgi:zinc transport system substrate-binding protein